jgi:hypothetical protein
MELSMNDLLNEYDKEWNPNIIPAFYLVWDNFRNDTGRTFDDIIFKYS